MNTKVRGRSLVRRVAVAGALGASALMVAPQASYAASRTYPLAVVSTDYRFQGVPGRLPSGSYNLQHYNLGLEPHVFVAVNLGPQCSQSVRTTAQALAFLDTLEGPEDLAAACPGSSLAGDVFAPPGGRASGPLSLTPGRTLYFCPIPDAHGVSHEELGMIGFIDVFGVPSGLGF